MPCCWCWWVRPRSMFNPVDPKSDKTWVTWAHVLTEGAPRGVVSKVQLWLSFFSFFFLFKRFVSCVCSPGLYRTSFYSPSPVSRFVLGGWPEEASAHWQHVALLLGASRGGDCLSSVSFVSGLQTSLGPRWNTISSFPRVKKNKRQLFLVLLYHKPTQTLQENSTWIIDRA